jgi:hypothetical protein
MEQLSLLSSGQEQDGQPFRPAAVVDRLQHYLRMLTRLERYERRALSARKRAVRLASLPNDQ